MPMAGFFRRLLGRGGGERTLLDKDPQLGRLAGALLGECEYALVVGDGGADAAVQLARRYPQHELLACEPKSEVYYRAENRAGDSKNIYLHNMAPGDFLDMVGRDKPYLLEKDVLVLLSAAGGGAERRFFDEVALVALQFQAAWLLVVGCRVPERDEFVFENHRGRECSLKNLAPSLASATHSLYIPGYSVPASKRRKTNGWCLAGVGRSAGIALPEDAVSLAIKVE